MELGHLVNSKFPEPMIFPLRASLPALLTTSLTIGASGANHPQETYNAREFHEF